MSSEHKCKSLVISCIDYRFVTRIRDYLIIKGLQDSYDLITIPGASLNLLKAKDTVATSFKLHDPSEVLIFDHEDCGAYGEDNSEKRHEDNLRMAQDLIQKMSSNIYIKTFIAGFEGVKEVN